jgi:hypothetical protein
MAGKGSRLWRLRLCPPVAGGTVGNCAAVLVARGMDALDGNMSVHLQIIVSGASVAFEAYRVPCFFVWQLCHNVLSCKTQHDVRSGVSHLVE